MGILSFACLLRMDGAVLLILCIVTSVSCLRITSWPREQVDHKINLTGMLLSKYGDHLIISGTNKVYNLNTSNLELLNNDTTGPYNASTDDSIKLMIYNQSYSGPEYVTTCSNTRKHCSIRTMENVKTTKWELQKFVKGISGVQAFTVDVVAGDRNDTYLFVGCPHFKGQYKQESLCNSPGVYWYKDSGDIENDGESKQGFKSYEDSKVKTEKFVAAFAVEKLRLFFSIQKKDKTKLSRIAQVCQTYVPKRGYSTPFTYVDMPIKCGDLTVIVDVKKVEVEDKTILFAVFSENGYSAVCAYNMSHVNRTFVENVRKCYAEKWNPTADEYYFRYTMEPVPIPCSTNMDEKELPENDEVYLCNTDYLETYHHMIGDFDLIEEPVVTFNTSISAVTIATVNSHVIAFLGTAESYILKANVYPTDTAGRIKQPVIHRMHYMIQSMLTSYDQRHILVLTEDKVSKLPAEFCSSFKTCNECIGGHDPYCGWCMLENRCSTRTKCKTENVWISSLPGNQCPSIRNIDPNPMSEKEIFDLKINVSDRIQHTSVTCVFDNVNFNTRNYTKSAMVDNDGYIVTCRPDFVPQEIQAIKGSLNVTVYIKTEKSPIPIMSGEFMVYNCKAFRSCSDCTKMKNTCIWDTYKVQCMYEEDKDSSSGNDHVREQKECPSADAFSVQVHDGNPKPMKVGTWYLSKDVDYNLMMTGSNLPEARTVGYSCKILHGSSELIRFNCTLVESNKVKCPMKKNEYNELRDNGELNATVQFTWGGTNLAGKLFNVVIYACENVLGASDNCGLCKSFVTSRPYYQCKWCHSSCVYNLMSCNDADNRCPDPNITKVNPINVAVNTTVQVKIEGTNLGSNISDIKSVSIAGKTCDTIPGMYDPGRRIVCQLEASNEPNDGKVRVTLDNDVSGEYSRLFSFKVPKIISIEPILGPYDGGTLVTIKGDNLDVGISRDIIIGGQSCKPSKPKSEINPAHKQLVCLTDSLKSVHGNTAVNVSVKFDDVLFDGGDNVNFTYVTNPTITSISPLKSFASGGRKLTVTGTDLYAVQSPKIYADFYGKRSKEEECTKEGPDKITCLSPRLDDAVKSNIDSSRRKRNVREKRAKIGFIMDHVSGVTADNLPGDIAEMIYYPDPVLYNLTNVKELKDIQENNLVIKGRHLDLAAERDDVVVMIGCLNCNITDFTQETILCKPPSSDQSCMSPSDDEILSIEVWIGYFSKNVGKVSYESMKPIPLADDDDRTDKIIIGVLLGCLALCMIIGLIIVYVMMKKRKNMKREIVIKLDKLEANFRNQCREEFANLQTTVSDLTSDLEGGNVLFREYSMYANKTLFTSEKTEAYKHPPSISSEQTQKAMDTFRSLLINTQFLTMFIKTLERQKSFTIHDKSNVATILMIINHDNMEYITGILTSLLNILVDKNIASGTPKLLLRRSESVAEKLLTHWLSICLYHHLKVKTGSSLYILYKAIKIQTEKGPIDYITNCGKYTLSEDKLLAFGDRDINPVSLTLLVKHYNYIEDEEKEISVNVQDVDTITQTKAKMLDILYKNVPYSQRPSVHSTTLEVEEDDGGTRKLLNDEDASSIKDGLWKRINTLQHYNIQNEAKVYLFLNREMEQSCKAIGGVANSPQSYIVGSFRKAKPAVRTISGSNFWHLTKKHQTDDEVAPASDLFLPRLTTTKMMLQPYIDQLFTSVLTLDEEPSIIIKYLFDFLDMAASRCGVTDVDVVHTWKCNSLLLRFWVNIIKNPEFVFDIHKPLLVDSCLSVVAQTLMDSCSTADLIVSKSSPSNKLLFAKDIPRYKSMVKEYFQSMKQKPAVSDQDLNSYLTQKVSQKFSGMFHTQSAMLELYNYAVTYKTEVFDELDNLEASSPGSFSPMSSKLQFIFMSMDGK